MRLCFFDPFSGIAGDMTVGALLDAGANFSGLEPAIAGLKTGATLRAEKVKRHGITATKFHVDGGEQKAHRHLHHIDKMVDESSLNDRVKERVKQVFLKLGHAEAKVHGVGIEKVHFHEVGATDSICDIVATCWCLDDLGIDEIHCAPINTGSGTVNTEHGLLPVPAPATAELLIGKPVYSRGPAMELTTPTGAAIVSSLARSFGSLPASKLIAAGYGAGDRDFKEQANVLRVLIAERSTATEATTISVIETNLDDASPQVLGHTLEQALSAGALDVTVTPVLMKKNRPGQILTVLAKPEDQERLAALILRETPALGLRIMQAERRVEERSWTEVNTSFGRVRVKVSQTGSFTPEYEDCHRLAVEKNVPLREILAAAGYEYQKSLR